MSKKEIQQEIEKLRSQMQELEKKLAQSSNLADEQVREEINDAARIYNNTLIQKGGLQGIGQVFGMIACEGKFKHRGIFLTNGFEDRDWEWLVDVDMNTDSEVLVRVNKFTGVLID
jgi:hypothetical protein